MKRDDPFQKIGELNRRNEKGTSHYIWALRDVNFKVNQGDVVGIIGKNGSGKSTLLKLLSRITSPTAGAIRGKGRVASLLEVGTGFHPDLTGRDNVYMNGAILGMSRADIRRKFDDIVQFSGVERYIDTPVKRYSSGMKVRLGFAVAAFLEPEILVVDEVLAVGDAEFQRRAIGKMQSISSDSGRTVLFVSHNMSSVLQLCNRGILLEDGIVAFDGAAEAAVNRYVGSLKRQTEFKGTDGDDALSLEWAKVSSGSDDGGVFANTGAIDVMFDVKITENIPSLVIGFNLVSQYDYPIARADYNDLSQLKTLSPGTYRFHFTIPGYTLAPGTYSVVFDVAERNRRRYTTEISNLSFDIIPDKENFGYVFPDVTPKKLSLIHSHWLRDVSVRDD